LLLRITTLKVLETFSILLYTRIAPESLTSICPREPRRVQIRPVAHPERGESRLSNRRTYRSHFPLLRNL